MNDKDPGLVPENEKGLQTNTESELLLPSEEEAIRQYQLVKQKLLRPNLWHEYAGKATAEFQLTDAEGNPVNREVREGDHFRIDIPGPGSATGDGYDWVRVELIDEQKSGNAVFTAIRVRPATNPQNDKQDVAHFFKDDATSSFVLARRENKLIAGVYGRNEVPNTDAENLLDKARNTAVAAGAMTGFAKIQWKSLVEGLLKKE